MKQKIREEVKRKIRRNKDVMYELSTDVYNVSFRTIERWLKKDSPMLMTLAALMVYEKHLKINFFDAVEDVKPTPKKNAAVQTKGRRKK